MPRSSFELQPLLRVLNGSSDWPRISNVVRYEGEHIVLYHKDRRLYSRTADHSRGGSHPILQ